MRALLVMLVEMMSTIMVVPRSRGFFLIPLGVGGLGLAMAFMGNERTVAIIRTVMISVSVAMFVLMLISFLFAADQIAGGSGAFGGRTGVMLKDLDPQLEDVAPKKPTLRRKGEAVPEWKLKPKVAAARAILDFLGETDVGWDRDKLIRRIENTALAIREALDDRDLGLVRDRLTSRLAKSLQAELDALAGRKERRIYGKIKVTQLRPIVVDAPAEAKEHRVVACITFESRDYTIDARKKVVDGAKNEIVVVQELWTFVRDGKTWLASRIEASENADDALSETSALDSGSYSAFASSVDRSILAEVRSV